MSLKHSDLTEEFLESSFEKCQHPDIGVRLRKLGKEMLPFV